MSEGTGLQAYRGPPSGARTRTHGRRQHSRRVLLQPGGWRISHCQRNIPQHEGWFL